MKPTNDATTAAKELFAERLKDKLADLLCLFIAFYLCRPCRFLPYIMEFYTYSYYYLGQNLVKEKPPCTSARRLCASNMLGVSTDNCAPFTYSFTLVPL